MARLIDQEYDGNGNIIAVTIEDDGYSCEFELVKHGRWIPMELNRSIGMFVGVGCSLCSFEKIGSGYKYCPSCGAKMDLEE